MPHVLQKFWCLQEGLNWVEDLQSPYENPHNPPRRRTLEYLVRSLEPIIGGKVNDDSRIPRPIQDRRDSAVEGAADETAGIQIPLIQQLLEDGREQVLWDPFTDKHR